MENIRQFPWGTLTCSTKSYGEQLQIYNGYVWDDFKGCDIFESEGYFGCSRKGEVLLPASMDQIEFLQDGEAIYFRLGKNYCIFSENGCNQKVGECSQDNGEFYENGRMGWRVNGLVTVPPMYDRVWKWSGADLYYTKYKDTVKYVDSKGNECLTADVDLTGIDFEGDGVYWEVYGDNNLMSASCIVPESYASQYKNVVRRDDGRYMMIVPVTVDAINKMMTSGRNIFPITPAEMSLFNNHFSYEFSCYEAMSKATNPFEDILQQFKDLNVFCNSWHYIMKIWVAEDNALSADQIRQFRNDFTAACRKNGLLSLHVAVGTKKDLEPGEIRAMLITHYHEFYFPPQFVFDWWDALEEGDPEKIRTSIESMPQEAVECVREQDAEDSVKGEYFQTLKYFKYKEGRCWEDSEKVLDLLYGIDECFKSRPWFHNHVGEIFKDVDKLREADRDRIIFEVNLVDWYLRHGAADTVWENDYTLLDMLSQTSEQITKDAGHLGIPDWKHTILKKTVVSLIAGGVSDCDKITNDRDKAGQSRVMRELEWLCIPK